MQPYLYKANSNADAGLIQTVQQAGESCWAKALPDGDARPIAAMYGEQGKAFVPMGRAVEGKEALQSAWQEGLDNGVRRVAIETHEVEQDGALGYESGSYAILDPQGAVFESGSYVIVWRHESGAWKWHRHIWTPHVKAG